MHFNVGDIPERLDDDVVVGDVYPAKGGRGDTHFWVVVSLGSTGRFAHCLGINREGKIVSTVGYALYALRERGRIGFCPEVEQLELSIRWSE